MSSGRRIALLAIAAVVLVGGFLVARSTGDDDAIAPSEPTQTVAPATEPSASTAPREDEIPAPPPARVIRIRDRAPVGEPPTLTYQSGDTVRLRFRSNVAEEVHVHGFDEYVDVPAGGTATLNFEADAEGIFEVESHGSGELLARLEIRPR